MVRVGGKRMAERRLQMKEDKRWICIPCYHYSVDLVHCYMNLAHWHMDMIHCYMNVTQWYVDVIHYYISVINFGIYSIESLIGIFLDIQKVLVNVIFL